MPQPACRAELAESSVEESWTNFNHILENVVNSCTPLNTRRSCKNNKLNWWNNRTASRLLQKEKKKKRAYHKHLSTRHKGRKLEYNRLWRDSKKLTRHMKKTLKSTHYVASVTISNPKEQYTYVWNISS